MTYSESNRHIDDPGVVPSPRTSTSQSADPRSGDVQLKCSLCGNAYWRSESKVVPFCSRRCQQIDLGNWLDERYGFPVEGSEDAAVEDPEPDMNR